MTSTVRCSELWYEDGNIVFDAQGTLFRVYRGILAANSSVFADMFSFPQPPTDMESYEGCPLIRISDDPDEFKFFLKAIHDASFYAQDVPNPYPVVVAILRLASKYDVSYLRARAKHQLSHDFPVTLAEFQGLAAGTTPRLVQGLVDKYALAELLREVDALHMLPAVLFGICEEAPGMEHVLDCALGPANKRACGLGLYALKHRLCRFITSLRSTLFGRCTMGGNVCRATRERMLDWLAAYNCRLLKLPKNPIEYSTGMCPVCAYAWVDWVRTEEQAMWDTLPAIFGLPPWNELCATEH